MDESIECATCHTWLPTSDDIAMRECPECGADPRATPRPLTTMVCAGCDTTVPWPSGHTLAACRAARAGGSTGGAATTRTCAVCGEAVPDEDLAYGHDADPPYPGAARPGYTGAVLVGSDAYHCGECAERCDCDGAAEE